MPDCRSRCKTDDIPADGPAVGLQTGSHTDRTGNQWKFRFSCPKAQGAGVATFISDREFTTHVIGTFNATGLQQKGSLESRAVWLGQDLRDGQAESLISNPHPVPVGASALRNGFKNTAGNQ